MALDLGDDELVGLACQNLGVLANLRGDYREARSRYLEGIGSFVRSGSTASAMLAYNNLGSASADLREWMEAEVFFTRGLEIAERLRHTPSAGMLYSNLAEPLIRVGELARAAEALDRAQSAASQVGDQATLADVARFRALAARLAGEMAEAERHAGAALEIATRHGLELERAEALLELAEVHAAAGRPAAAGAAFREASQRFQRLGMPADAHGAWLRAGEVEPGRE
jgi:tetratricopeptide (TPR) repeat protein